MMMPPLAWVASRERVPDREWVRSERRAENPGIRKEEDELRLDSWIVNKAGEGRRQATDFRKAVCYPSAIV